MIPVLAILAAASQLPSLSVPALVTGFLLTALGGALYLARHWVRGGAGSQDHANEQIDSLNTPLMKAARTRPLKRAHGSRRYR